MRPAKHRVTESNPLRDVMGSWVTRRIAVGVRCAGCGDVVAVEVVRVKRVENLPHPTTTIALARQALRRHGDAKGCIETGESDDTLPLVYRSAEQAHTCLPSPPPDAHRDPLPRLSLHVLPEVRPPPLRAHHARAANRRPRARAARGPSPSRDQASRQVPSGERNPSMNPTDRFLVSPPGVRIEARPLFLFENGCPEWVIAHDEEDAVRVYLVATGEDSQPDDWERLDSLAAKVWYLSEKGELTDTGGTPTRMTNLAACDHFGHGFYASSEL